MVGVDARCSIMQTGIVATENRSRTLQSTTERHPLSIFDVMIRWLVPAENLDISNVFDRSGEANISFAMTT